MMMHFVGGVILDKEQNVWREKNSLECVVFEMPSSNGRCPVKYCFHWLGTEKWKMESISIISVCGWLCAVFELPKSVQDEK